MGRAVTRADCRRPLTAKVLVQSQTSSCGICDGQSGTGTGLCTSTSFFPMSVAPVLQTHEFIHHRRHMILANIFVKQYTKKVLIFLFHISYVFFGRLEPFDFRDLNSVACVVPCMSSCCVCGSESCFISFFVSFTHNIWNI